MSIKHGCIFWMQCNGGVFCPSGNQVDCPDAARYKDMLLNDAMNAAEKVNTISGSLKKKVDVDIRLHLGFEMDIRLDCYVAVIEKFKKEYPDAIFEVITRQVFPPWHIIPSVLSPTWELLTTAKREQWPIDQYFNELSKQFINDTVARKELIRLRDIARSGKTVFLVCVEKDASKCHRTLVKKLIENIHGRT
jgi:hypothetical protein